MILALLLQAVAVPSAAATPPNVVLIISDDQAWTDFGFMGHDVIRTPRLDELARESAFFPHAYVPTSLCRPSLATMITGLYPHQHGLTGNDPPAGVDRERMLAHIAGVETLPKILGRAGYASLQTGKWWEGNYANGGFTEGMTHGDPARGGRHGDEGLAIGRETMAPILTFLDECAESETPFFLWYAPFLPHSPHNPPARLLAKYEQEGRPLPIAKYMAMCEWFDETCGTVLDALDERGLAENTLVLFASDNGWIQRPDARGFAPRSKRTPYEGGVRTPILVRWPGVVTPGVHDVPVSTIDLAPTVLAACGADVPEAMPGASLLDVGEDGAPERGPVFGESFTHDVGDVNEPARSLLARWVVDGRWKLVRTRAPEPRLELFDLEEDPREERELSGAHQERVAALSQAIDDWWPAATPARPNVLFLLTDDQRADAMGSAGHPFLATPSMDSLAARGVRFTNAFVTTSICAASRASILTSLHERAHGYTFGTPPITDRIAKDSYPSLLRAAGYRTGFVGKWGVKVGKGARDRMFDVFRPLGTNPYMKERPDGTVRHLTDITADEAIAFLERASQEGSFCLSVSFNAPHAEDGDPRQYIWPSALDGLYDDAPIPAPPLFEPAFFDAQPEFLRESLGRKRYGWRFDTEQKRIDMTRGYYRMITGVDRAIARILAALDSLELADDTVVIFSSDNGYFLGERGFAGKWLIYEDSVRVPLVVFDPRAAADRRGKTADAMALNVDIAPTILDLAGVEAPASYQGKSLVPLLRGEDPPWRADFFYEHLFDHPAIPKSRGVRGERWVYVQYFEQEPMHEELYDLAADPLEAHDLARDPEHAAVLATMRARCDELAAEREPIAAWGPPPDEDRFELATLASGLDKPLELAVAPDGRVFFIEQGGRVAVYRPDVGAVALVGNSPPELRFLAPEDGAFFDPERPLAWSVDVFDEEDGDTESNPFDLPLRVVVSAALDATGPLGHADGPEGERDAPGFARMKRSDCFNCHTFDKKIVGPALHEIAERYRGDAAAIETAAGRVIAGSSGVWSEVPMLPHAQHTLEETRLMVRWITSLEAREAAQVIQVGIGGQVDASELAPEGGGGVLTLEATYTDAGGGPVGPLATSARVTLRSRRVEAEHYTTRSGTQTLDSTTASAGASSVRSTTRTTCGSQRSTWRTSVASRSTSRPPAAAARSSSAPWPWTDRSSEASRSFPTARGRSGTSSTCPSRTLARPATSTSAS